MKPSLQLLLSMLIAASFVPLAAFAEPPQKAQDTSTQATADIEIAVEKLERDKSERSNIAPPTDVDGDGYGDVATAARPGDPIPDIDITVSASEANPPGSEKPKDVAASQVPAKKKGQSLKCKNSEKDCDPVR